MQLNVKSLSEKLIGEEYLSSIIYHLETDSTNKQAKSLNDGDNILILTDHQTSGSGRFGRQWISENSTDISLSLIKKFRISIDKMHLINFYTSYLIQLTLSELYSKNDLRIVLKWPNDILMNKKKVCGILLDVQDLNAEKKKFIIGIGINCNTTEFSTEIISKATSLKKETGNEVSREDIIVRFVKNFYDNLSVLNEPNKLMNKWRENTEIIGKEIKFRMLEDGEEITGKVNNIENDGGLKIEISPGNFNVYYSGQITFGY
ncbi:biotin--[acetyl-CoA-carboxylase] ligase [soil metagenome]